MNKGELEQCLDRIQEISEIGKKQIQRDNIKELMLVFRALRILAQGGINILKEKVGR